jgi:hypothetical protein
MATKKDTGRYRVLRDCAVGAAGDVVDLPDDQAADLIRDGMITPEA